MFFRLIPKGEFRIGARGFRDEYGTRPDEEPAHRVLIPDDFYLGTFPVTQGQYRAMAKQCREQLAAIEDNKGAEPSQFTGDLRPVEQVGWDDAVAVCGWLTRSGLLPAGWSAGLPNEAQWEYACRAGTDTDYWNGDGEVALAEVGWYDGNSGNETHPVGEKPANGFGLHDMHGNVWEWCADEGDEHAYRKRIDGWEARARDAEGSNKDRDRVIRGGSWYFTAGYCRSAFRFGWWPGFRDRYQGFRVCLFPGPVETVQEQPEAGLAGPIGGRGTSPEMAGPCPAEGEGPGDIDLGAASFPPSGGRRNF